MNNKHMIHQVMPPGKPPLTLNCLPPEISNQIIHYLEPEDPLAVISLCLTSKHFHAAVSLALNSRLRTIIPNNCWYCQHRKRALVCGLEKLKRLDVADFQSADSFVVTRLIGSLTNTHRYHDDERTLWELLARDRKA